MGQKERPGFPDIPGTLWWGYGRKKLLAIYRTGAVRLSRTLCPVPAINNPYMMCHPSARECVHGCTQAIFAYHRLVDLTEIRIVDARWRPMILLVL